MICPQKYKKICKHQYFSIKMWKTLWISFAENMEKKSAWIITEKV